MLNWLSNFQIEKISFFLGFFSAIILIFASSKVKKYLPEIKKYLSTYSFWFQRNQLNNIRDLVYKNAYFQAQSNHLAKDLFPLDEILIEPAFMVQPDIPSEENTTFHCEISSIVPSTPDFPVLSRNYNYPRLNTEDILKSRANIVICGLPGAGKTVALSHLVSLLVNHPKKQSLPEKTPFLISAHDINVDIPFTSIIDILVDYLSMKIQNAGKNQLQKFIRNEIELNNCILLIDSLDELHPDQHQKFVHLLEQINEEKPDLQIITTATPIYLGNLIKLGFSPIYISNWSNNQIVNFYEKWGSHWTDALDNVAPEYQTKNSLIKSWVSSNLSPMTPLEYTLFVWGAFSGNLSGQNIKSFISSYLDRVLPDKKQQNNLSSLAYKCLMDHTHQLVEDKKAEELEIFIKSGIIEQVATHHYKFKHSQILSYLAFLSVDQNEPQFSKNDNYWPTMISYFGFKSKIPELLMSNFENSEDFASKLLGIYQISYLAKHSQHEDKTHNQLIKLLVNIIQNRDVIFELRLRALAGLIQTNNSNIPILVRQMMSKNEIDFLQFSLYTIGCMNKESSFINDILKLTKASSQTLKKLAYLVLTTFREDVAMHELGKALLSEHEKIRQIIAESFAFENDQGEEILKEAITLDEIVVRRSAIFGLIKINEDWAKNILSKLAIEDSQWVIRNAASQATEFLAKENPIIPKRIAPIYKNQWLIKFAGKNNLGVAKGQSNSNVLIMALLSNDPKDIMNATRLAIFEHNHELIDKMIEILKISTIQPIKDQIILTLQMINSTSD